MKETRYLSIFLSTFFTHRRHRPGSDHDGWRRKIGKYSQVQKNLRGQRDYTTTEGTKNRLKMLKVGSTT